MPTTQSTKRAMRAYLLANPKAGPVPKMVYSSPVWGKGAKTAAWRVTSFKFGKQNARTANDSRLQDLLFPPSFGDAIVKVAEAELGVHEVGSTNTGSMYLVSFEATAATEATTRASPRTWRRAASITPSTRTSSWTPAARARLK